MLFDQFAVCLMHTTTVGPKDVFLIQDLYFRVILVWFILDHTKLTEFQGTQTIKKALANFPKTQPSIIHRDNSPLYLT